MYANVYSTTIAFNVADSDADPNGGSGGGVYNNGGVFNLRNTMLVGNSVSGVPIYENCTGVLGSYGQNPIGEEGEPTPCTINIADGGSWTQINSLALIGLLANNGGPTQTYALLPGSNAINGGDPIFGCVGPASELLATDQRGAPRVTGARCDIGAFEVPEPASILACATAMATLASMRRAARDAG